MTDRAIDDPDGLPLAGQASSGRGGRDTGSGGPADGGEPEGGPPEGPATVGGNAVGGHRNGNRGPEGQGGKEKRCPICSKPAVTRFRPFCSKRCADVDLNRWLGGHYAIPAVDADFPDGEDLESDGAETDPGRD